MLRFSTYDQKSYDLAEHFLQDEPGMNTEKHKRSLALEIQQCIEDEIYFMREVPELYPELSK